MAWQSRRTRKGLAEEEVEEWVRLSRGCIEHIHRSKSAATGPAIGSDPTRLGARSRPCQLGRNRMPISGDALVAHVVEIVVAIFQVEHTAIAIIHSRRDIGIELLLEHQPHAVSLKIAALISERPRINIR